MIIRTLLKLKQLLPLKQQIQPLPSLRLLSSNSNFVLKFQKATGIIISALGDVLLRVVIEADEDPGKMLKLLDAIYASNRTVSRIAVKTQIFRMDYTTKNMSTYIDQYS